MLSPFSFFCVWLRFVCSYTDDTEEPQYVTTAQQAGSGGGETLYGTNDESPEYEKPDALNENPEYVALATQDTAVSQVLYAATN